MARRGHTVCCLAVCELAFVAERRTSLDSVPLPKVMPQTEDLYVPGVLRGSALGIRNDVIKV